MAKKTLEQLVNEFDTARQFGNAFSKEGDSSDPNVRQAVNPYIRQFYQRYAQENPNDQNIQQLNSGIQQTDFMNAPDHVIRQAIQQIAGDSEKKLVDYVSSNYDRILKTLDTEKLEKLTYSTLPKKTGNKEHDEIAQMHLAYLIGSKALHEKDIGEIQKEVVEIFKSDPLGLGNYILRDERALFAFYHGVIKYRQDSLTSRLKGNESKYLDTNIAHSKEDEKNAFYLQLAQLAKAA